MVGFNDACLDIDHSATFAGIGSDLTLTNIHMDCTAAFEQDDESDEDGNPLTDPMDIDTEFFALGAGNTLGSDGGLAAPFDLESPDFTSTATGATTPADAFFDTADHIGAVGSDDWTAGWTTSAKN